MLVFELLRKESRRFNMFELLPLYLFNPQIYGVIFTRVSPHVLASGLTIKRVSYTGKCNSYLRKQCLLPMKTWADKLR